MSQTLLEAPNTIFYLGHQRLRTTGLRPSRSRDRSQRFILGLTRDGVFADVFQELVDGDRPFLNLMVDENPFIGSRIKNDLIVDMRTMHVSMLIQHLDLLY